MIARFRTHGFWIFLLIAGLVISGCSGFRQWLIKGLDHPVISLESIDLPSFSREGFHLDLTLSLYNPNAITLSLEEIRYTFALNDQELANGQSREPVSIPAQDTVFLPLTLEGKFADVGKGILSLLSNTQWNYKFTGTLTFTILGGKVEVPFNQQGSIQNFLKKKS